MRHFAFLLLVAGAFGQKSQIPYAPDSDGPGPTFASKDASRWYTGAYSSIRKVDFRNFRYLTFDETGKPAESFPLKNGHYEDHEPYGNYSMNLDAIYYLPTVPSSKGSSALVLYSWFAAGGSSSQGGTAEVFTVSDGRLLSTQRIDWDTHFQAGQPTESFDPRTSTLVIRSAHYIPGDAHCCISAMDIVTFRWDGTGFAQSGIRTELSGYGKAQRKTLPH